MADSQQDTRLQPDIPALPSLPSLTQRGDAHYVPGGLLGRGERGRVFSLTRHQPTAGPGGAEHAEERRVARLRPAGGEHDVVLVHSDRRRHSLTGLVDVVTRAATAVGVRWKTVNDRAALATSGTT